MRFLQSTLLLLGIGLSTTFAEDGAKPSPPAAETSPRSPPVAEYPSPAIVVARMRRAVEEFRSLSLAGGYPTSWPRDLSEARTENRASPTMTSIQPPGTPTVGMAMLEAWRATGDPLFRQGAQEAAESLLWCQLASGGWGSEFDYDRRSARKLHFRRDLEGGDRWAGGRKAHSSLDDNKTQSALLYLLELVHTPGLGEDAPFRSALEFGFRGLLDAQAPNGGWPQRFSGPADPGLPVQRASLPEDWPREWADAPYDSHYTLNDGNLLHVVRLLLRAQELGLEVPGLSDAVPRLGKFLLLAQLPAPQPGWAQQYDPEMKPVWARKFEPPAVSTVESLSAMKTLFEIWLATGDPAFRETLPAALGWLEESAIEEGKWARFYELGTNRPLYCKAETYELTYDDFDLPTHYGFQISGTFGEKVAGFREELGRSREETLADRSKEPREERQWAKRARGLAGEVREAMKRQRQEGYWLNGDGEIDTRLFASNLAAMAGYVHAANQAGDAFRERWEAAELERGLRVAGIVAVEDADGDWWAARIREAASRRADVVVLGSEIELGKEEREGIAQYLGIRLAVGEFRQGGTTVRIGKEEFRVLDAGGAVLAVGQPGREGLPGPPEEKPRHVFYYDIVR